MDMVRHDFKSLDFEFIFIADVSDHLFESIINGWMQNIISEFGTPDDMVLNKENAVIRMFVHS